MKAFNTYSKKTRIAFCVITAFLVIAITLSIALPLAIKNTSSAHNTDYDLVKTTKMNNFTFLNKSAEHNQIVLIGDSITEIYNSTDLFSNFMLSNNKIVYNRGISGDTSDKMLERLESNALNITPTHLVILIGTNDIGKGIDNSVIETNISAAIKLTKEKSPNTKIILQSVYPVNKNMSAASRSMVGSRQNSVINELNKKLAAVAAANDFVQWLDLTEALSDKNGNLIEAYTYDGLHPNAVGFAEVTKHLLPLLS